LTLIPTICSAEGELESWHAVVPVLVIVTFSDTGWPRETVAWAGWAETDGGESWGVLVLVTMLT
jgi:hypothetical protein